MADKKFMSLDEYSKEFVKSGEKNFYDFLERKRQEALGTGDQELANHIQTIYNQAYKDEERYYEDLQEEDERKKKDEERKRQEEIDAYDEYEDYEEQTPTEKEYEDYLLAIERCEQKIAEYEELLEDESLDDQERENYESLISSEQADIDYYTAEAKKLQYTIEMARLGTSLTIMTPEEIEEAYVELLEERDSFTYMEEDGIEVSDEALELNKDKLELIEGFAQSSPEIQALIQAQKEKYARMAEKGKQTEKELLDSMEYEESFRDAPSEEIDALLGKEIKSKEARDAGFEVDEYGEIITPEKKTPEELEDMTEEELQQIIDNNEQTIEENKKAIKKALVERLLSQQRIISDQQLEISKLNSQNKEL